jgi:hypothetical protein
MIRRFMWNHVWKFPDKASGGQDVGGDVVTMATGGKRGVRQHQAIH